jgi:hypothetical protein
MMLLILAFFFQATDIPVPTYELPAPVQTLEARGQEYSEELSTIEALGEGVDIDGNGISVNGEQINPILDNNLYFTAIGYMKWIGTSGAELIFGPLGELVPHIFTFILLSFAEPVIMTIKRALATVAAVLSWIAENFVAFLVISIIIAIVVALLNFTGWFAEQWSRFVTWF